MCDNLTVEKSGSHSVGKFVQDDVDERVYARASPSTDLRTKIDDEIPPKKRKTRRGKNKRRHPYERKNAKVVKPEAPYNSNRFLIEDHGNIEELDEKLRKGDCLARTRDSSFSMDSDGEFYSSPDDEEEFLIRDFDDQYENLRAERLNNMSKSELIAEYLQLEKKVELLTKRTNKNKSAMIISNNESNVNNKSEEIDLKIQVERLLLENEKLKQELIRMQGKLSEITRLTDNDSDSEDSESDSSVSCSSCSSSKSSMSEKSRSKTPLQNGTTADYSKTNGLSPTVPA